ncbi:nitrate- and nitrite sensing domain-containing protein [Streptomyces sp. ISL-98]|uniref:nitrate- and nitrite sensing domain-containing protein n=1 Tax=Streptomyces sp. ISL-98 TaxID=2819192 RepID=UPI001BE7C028|nr:nitrate- and nitrite sensing domain-containing protein [Streptomyces sp. ISL-98]MBT2505929.1 nitrate- and nitrite sensing domain-containing protein [Streptomyces sp. ISL-98]
MQKKRPRGGSGNSGNGENGERTERTVRVRSRLVAGVAVVGVVVLAAGAPAIISASSELSESQRLVTLAELNRQAVTLAHSLADERDDVTAYIAAGRGSTDTGTDTGGAEGGKGLSEARSARVDRQMDEIEAAAPAGLRRDLAKIPGIRRAALTGKGTALEAHKAYSQAIEKLQDLADELADKTPPRAADATLPQTSSGGTPISLRSPGALGKATEQAAATRGLLVAALSVPRENTGSRIDPVTGLLVPAEEDPDSESARTRNALTAAAQQSRVRELAALADFDQVAGSRVRENFKTTVTGPDVKTAEQFLTRLTDQPTLSEAEGKTDPAKAEAAFSARIELMRGAESALGAVQAERLAQLRDDDVTALEIRIALAGACFLFAVGVSTGVARTLTQPLAVLRIGAARLAAEPESDDAEAAEPVRFTGRNDEFAQVVRSLNTLHGRLAEVGARAEKFAGDRTHLIGQRETLATQRAELQEQVAEAAAQLERMRHTIHSTFVNLSLRTLGVVDRQLGVIESLEEREQDPERLATLFKLDHMATVMRRHGENLLVLAGTDHGHAHAHGHGQQGPVPLVDVLRAAVSEIERYERVVIQSLPPHTQVAGFAANDLSHLLAELLENATSFSPPDAKVELSGWLLESGEVMLSVQDEGIGMAAERLTELNARLAEPAAYEPGDGIDGGIGLHVAALLAARHGVRVQLREQKGGGIAAVVVLPDALLPSSPPAAVPPAVTVAGDAPTLNLPGSVAEANSNALPGRSALEVPEKDAQKDQQQDAEADPQKDQLEAPAPQADLQKDQPDGPLAADPLKDPLVAAAERTIREKAAKAEPEQEQDKEPTREPEPLAEADPELSAEAALEPEAEREPQPDPELLGASELPAEAEREPESQPDPESLAASELAAEHESLAGPGQELFAEVEPQPDTELLADSESAAAYEPSAEAGSTPEDEREPESQPETLADADPQPESGSELPPQPEPGPVLPSQREPLAGGKSVGLGGGPVARPYAIGPDTHERTDDGDPDTEAPVDEPTRTMRLPRQASEAVPSEPQPEPRAEHVAVGAAGLTGTDDSAPATAPAPAPVEPITDKGLPKRTPHVVKSGPERPAERTRSVDADALRRRLGGFHQGAKDGRRDVEAEISSNGDRTDTEGDTVEEERS